MSSYCFISDIHVQKKTDEGAVILRKFLEHSVVQSSQNIIFLGDIFDYLIGEKKDYLDRYSFFFEGVLTLLENSKTVIFLEGNHDFHFEKIFTDFININSSNSHLFSYHKDGSYIELGARKYYFCHGDEVDYDNEAFKRWKKIYRSIPFQFLVNKLMPSVLVVWLGEKAAKDSKRRGRKNFEVDKAKSKYLIGAKKLIKDKKVDGVIAGHTHIPEIHFYDDGKVYINCGFPKNDQHFIYLSDTKLEKIKLI